MQFFEKNKQQHSTLFGTLYFKKRKFVKFIIIFKIDFEALYGQIRVKDGNIN